MRVIQKKEVAPLAVKNRNGCSQIGKKRVNSHSTSILKQFLSMFFVVISKRPLNAHVMKKPPRCGTEAAMGQVRATWNNKTKTNRQ
jgi:hypothetical protein